MMTTQSPVRLLDHPSECRCENCPPERVCAWACVQGMNIEDIIIGAMLEDSTNWAFQTERPEAEPVRQALWNSFNG